MCQRFNHGLLPPLLPPWKFSSLRSSACCTPAASPSWTLHCLLCCVSTHQSQSHILCYCCSFHLSIFAVLHLITIIFFSLFLSVFLFPFTPPLPFFISVPHDLHSADCHPLSPASRHVVSSISRAYFYLWTPFPLKKVTEHVSKCICLYALMCFYIYYNVEIHSFIDCGATLH